MGLPSLTSSYAGELPARLTGRPTGRPIEYSPLITTASNQSSHMFALSLSRNHSESYLSFGGIPAGLKTTGEWATAPMKKVPTHTLDPRGKNASLLTHK